MKLNILKKSFSENTVRKALYWLSEDATWTMKDEKEVFIIDFTPKENKVELQIEEKFNELLNDFYLRDIHNSSTKNLRKDIIEQALKKVYLHNV